MNTTIQLELGDEKQEILVAKFHAIAKNLWIFQRKYLQSDTLARPASVVTGTLGISRSFMFGCDVFL